MSNQPVKFLNLKKKLKTIQPNSSIAIGHTRWATHGLPNDANSHPHLSNDEKNFMCNEWNYRKLSRK